jgi:hypothetical protein
MNGEAKHLPVVGGMHKNRAMDASEERCIASIKDGLDHHRNTCPMKPRAVYVAREVYERYGSEDWAVCGVPVLPEEGRPVDRFRVDCPGSANGVEKHAALWLAEEAVRAADSETAGDPRPYAG